MAHASKKTADKMKFRPAYVLVNSKRSTEIVSAKVAELDATTSVYVRVNARRLVAKVTPTAYVFETSDQAMRSNLTVGLFRATYDGEVREVRGFIHPELGPVALGSHFRDERLRMTRKEAVADAIKNLRSRRAKIIADRDKIDQKLKSLSSLRVVK
jgi:hypothetical protein